MVFQIQQQIPRKLEHKDLSYGKYSAGLLHAQNLIKSGLTPIEAVQKAIVPQKSKINLSLIQNQYPTAQKSNLFSIKSKNDEDLAQLKIWANRVFHLLRLEAEETARNQNEVGYKSRHLYTSRAYSLVFDEKVQRIAKYLKKNNIYVRTQEQNAAEMRSFCTGVVQNAFENEDSCYFITLILDEDTKKLDVEIGLEQLKEINTKIFRLKDAYGFSSIEPHAADASGHLHSCLFVPKSKSEKFEKYFYSIFKNCDYIKNKQKRLYQFEKIPLDVKQYGRVVNYTTKAATYAHDNFCKWKKLHRLRTVNTFGFKGAKTLWRMSRRFSAEDVANMPQSPFKSLICYSRSNDSFNFLKTYREKKIKSWGLNLKYINSNGEISYRKLETVAFSSGFDFLVISYEQPRPKPLLFENIPALITQIKNQTIKTKTNLYGDISISTYENLKNSRLVIKSSKSEVDLNHPLCFLPDDSFSLKNIQKFISEIQYQNSDKMLH